MTEKVNLDHTPAHSFGIKVVREKTSDTPGKLHVQHIYNLHMLYIDTIVV